MKHLKEDCMSAAVTEFSWDLKYAGAQILISEVFTSPLSPIPAPNFYNFTITPSSIHHQHS